MWVNSSPVIYILCSILLFKPLNFLRNKKGSCFNVATRSLYVWAKDLFVVFCYLIPPSLFKSRFWKHGVQLRANLCSFLMPYSHNQFSNVILLWGLGEIAFKCMPAMSWDRLYMVVCSVECKMLPWFVTVSFLVVSTHYDYCHGFLCFTREDGLLRLCWTIFH